jgi:hypothetical protein
MEMNLCGAGYLGFGLSGRRWVILECWEARRRRRSTLAPVGESSRGRRRLLATCNLVHSVVERIITHQKADALYSKPVTRRS